VYAVDTRMTGFLHIEANVKMLRDTLNTLAQVAYAIQPKLVQRMFFTSVI